MLGVAQTDSLFVDFSPKGGPYQSEQTVVLTAPEGARIFYTLDGSSPNSSNNAYKNPIQVKSVAVIRAIAYLNGKRSIVITNSYFCDRSYNLPIVSISTEPGNLWDFNTGIYVEGCCADTIEPYVGANYWKDWERSANIEMYEPSGELCFNQLAGINLFGGFSRILPQKSLAVFARSKYGDKRFRYPIFPERDFSKYKSFIIRNAGGDFLHTHLRDAYMTQLAKPTGIAIQAYRPAVVFLNGEYWGIQNLREKISEHYLKSNYDVDKDNVDILRHNGVKRHGYSTNYKKFLAYLRANDLADDAKVEALRKFMDIEDYIAYNIAETYSDNRDAGGNIRYWRERNDSAKWRWIFYDLDLGLGNNEPNGYKNNTLKKFTNANGEAWPDPAWSTFIIRSLLKNKELEYQYINTFADHLNTVYHPDTALTLWKKMTATIDAEMHFHQKRWHSSYDNWIQQQERVTTFIKERPTYVREHIQEKFDLAGTINVRIVYPGKDTASIQFNSLKIQRNFEGVYFKGVPVTIEVDVKHDFEFKGWKGRSETSNKITVVSNENLVLEPIILAKELSIWHDSIVFNEINVTQMDSDTSMDWIELYNRSNATIDISGWGFTKAGYKSAYFLPAGTNLVKGQYLVISRKVENFQSTYDTDSIHIIGDFEFGLPKEGGRIKLYDNDGLIVDSLSYLGIDPDSSVSYNLIHPDSTGWKNWRLEEPNPGQLSTEYLSFLKEKADEKKWRDTLFITGGSFFFILVAGLFSFLYYRKRKSRKLVE